MRCRKQSLSSLGSVAESRRVRTAAWDLVLSGDEEALAGDQLDLVTRYGVVADLASTCHFDRHDVRRLQKTSDEFPRYGDRRLYVPEGKKRYVMSPALRALFSGCRLTHMSPPSPDPAAVSLGPNDPLLNGVPPVPTCPVGATGSDFIEAARPQPSGGHLWCLDDSVIITCLKVIRRQVNGP